ncbi:uncharacterized protein [Prorops nasuta]|uniref:uncharacterized protein n=1 Tax=Prorops nasuta TaxID=863751 RepID=UPI0034CE6E0C
MKVSIVTVVSITLILSNECLAGRLNLSPENDFILHSCTATSALLIRKHRNEDGTKKTPIFPLRRFNDLRKRNTNIHGTTKSPLHSERLKDSKTRNNNKARRHFGAKNLKETPLATIDVDLIHKDTPVFKKKSPLPTLKRNISARKIKEPADVIIIMPAV